jgi:predicted NodU family carbamoyl transferase
MIADGNIVGWSRAARSSRRARCNRSPRSAPDCPAILNRRIKHREDLQLRPGVRAEHADQWFEMVRR